MKTNTAQRLHDKNLPCAVCTVCAVCAVCPVCTIYTVSCQIYTGGNA